MTSSTASSTPGSIAATRRVRALVGVAAFALFLAIAPDASAQSGVLIPSSVSDKPNPDVIALTEMAVDVKVDRQIAHTRVVQIFANRTERPIEGTYVFAIPTTAAISDFAVWDGDVRIPGVILERKRARQAYEEIAARAIDPGLLEQEDEEASATAFTVRIAPVPAYGTKRLELEYTEILPVDDLQSYYSFPLKPSQYGQQLVGHLRIDVEVLSGFPLTAFGARGAQLPLAIDREEPNAVAAHYEGTEVTPSQDFAFTYAIAVPESRLDVVAYRAPERISPDELRDPSLAARQPDGYFQASAIFNPAGRAPGVAAPDAPPRSIVVMLDTSLSMSGEKLDRAFEAIQHFLGALTPADRFNLLLFNDDVVALGDGPVAATPAEVERALAFVRASYLSGGTDLDAALEKGVDAASKLPDAEGGRAIVVVTDGNPTLATTKTRQILDGFKRRNDAGPRARLDVFGVGGDTRVGLLGELARESGGLFVWSRETEDIELKLHAFFAKVGRAPIDALELAVSGGDVYQVYPDGGAVGYDGSAIHFAGRYRRPGDAVFTLEGRSPRGGVALRTTATLPERDDSHPEVPRLWARARVDALLRQIELEGESDEAISEIIALSKRYKFVTPYTSFLAAPRSLLRPRTIRPGDPVLRVATDPSIRSVVAVFPFGLVKPLRYLEDEGVWETRFLAPVEMADGQYACRLLLTDEAGRTIEETKRFRIDSRAPELRPRLEKAIVRAGEDATILVDADADTRWIAARLYGASPVAVRWNAERHANVGTLHVPEGLPPGVYTIRVMAEDFARNGAEAAVTLEVRAR